MPWQRMVADVGGEVIEDPETGLLIPAYRDVVFSTPRQSGKTTLVLGWECHRAVGFDHLGPQRIAYSAQTGADARKKLVQDQKPVLEPHKRALGIKRFYEGAGDVGVLWVNGSRLVVMNNTEGSGHGKTLDLGVKDEMFDDFDDRRDGAMRPAMITKPHAQVLTCSTMGTEDSIPWNALVERGRLAVDLDQRQGLAYFEWSAEDDDDPNDPATWYRCMPALGHTVTEAVIAGEQAGATPDVFLRAYLNRKTSAVSRVIPIEKWSAAITTTASPVGRPVFSLDVNPERSAGAIVAASSGVAEVVPRIPGDGFGAVGTAWLVPRAIQLSEKWDRPTWVVDATGPAASLIPAMEAAGLRVHSATSHEMVTACGQFFDGIMDGKIHLRQHAKLDEAAAGAAKRVIGDAWAWTRKNASADISPLVAATLALWGAETLPDPTSVYETRGMVTL